MPKRNKSNSTYKKPIMVSAGVIFVCLVLLQLSFNVFVYRKASFKDFNQSTLTDLIISAGRGLYHPAAVDAPSGKVYLHDVRLVLPATSYPIQQIQYANYGNETNDDTELQITTSTSMSRNESQFMSEQAAVNNPNAVMKAVPRFQACNRGVHIYFKAPSDVDAEQKFQAEKKLSDGRTVHIYSEKNCDFDQITLVDYLKQIDSY